QFETGQKFFPAPDLIVEVLSKGTEKRDRGIKFDDYQKHKIEEYWLVNPIQQVIEQYQLKNSTYDLILKSGSGEIKSCTIAGLQLPIPTIFDKKATNQFLKNI
ncbi:MAG: Uma2 family endonuclease, partial [Bacteroidota bacterium]